jgi:hypothetical protein
MTTAECAAELAAIEAELARRQACAAWLSSLPTGVPLTDAQRTEWDALHPHRDTHKENS